MSEKCVLKYTNKISEAIKKSKEISKNAQNQINALYKLCKELSDQTVVLYHVDHIKPISKGGLHHPDNLRIVTASTNLKKGAKYDVR